MTQLRCEESQTTHSGMRPQSRTLEVPVADNLRGVDETDRHIVLPRNIAKGSRAGESARARHWPRKGNDLRGQHGLRR